MSVGWKRGSDRFVIVGNSGGTNVGWSFWSALGELGLSGEFLDARTATSSARFRRFVDWRLRDRRPSHLGRFSREALNVCSRIRPAALLATGHAPLEASVLRMIGRMGIRRINFLTDDPWNPSLCSDWFLDALTTYDEVYSPRRMNLDDLQSLGVRNVRYLPFGFDQNLFFSDQLSEDDVRRFGCDVLFVGGGDSDRIPYLASLVHSGINVVVYGDYWDRFPATKDCNRGHADSSTLRKATTAAKICLCLVRRANRDGHVMRSFEIPASGGCMLAEDTPEHRDIFGEDGCAVSYFNSPTTMVDRVRFLLSHPWDRRRMADVAHRLVVAGGHTYRDRLATILKEGIGR